MGFRLLSEYIQGLGPANGGTERTPDGSQKTDLCGKYADRRNRMIAVYGEECKVRDE